MFFVVLSCMLVLSQFNSVLKAVDTVDPNVNETVKEYEYIDGNGALKTHAAKLVRANETRWGIEGTEKKRNEAWYVVDQDTVFDKSIIVSNYCTIYLILSDDVMLSANKGISADWSTEIIVYVQSKGTGGITSHGGDGAGIGSQSVNEGGKYTFYGGIIHTQGRRGITGNDVTIYGGDITAIGNDGAGIGGASDQRGGKVTIYGGHVNAISRVGSGIGSGVNYNDVKENGKITINGGVVEASSKEGSALGYVKNPTRSFAVEINGGALQATGKIPNATTFVNSNNEPVYKATVAIENEIIDSVSVDGKPYYVDESHSDGNANLYLSGENHTIEIRSATGAIKKWTATWDDESTSFDLTSESKPAPINPGLVSFTKSEYTRDYSNLQSTKLDVVVNVEDNPITKKSRSVPMNSVQLTITKSGKQMYSKNMFTTFDGDNKGTFNFEVDLNDFSSGEYDLKAEYGGSSSNTKSSANAKLKINKIDQTVTKVDVDKTQLTFFDEDPKFNTVNVEEEAKAVYSIVSNTTGSNDSSDVATIKGNTIAIQKAGKFYVKAMIDATENYKAKTIYSDVITVDEAKLKLEELPVATTFYGKQVKDILFTGGKVTYNEKPVAGTWKFAANESEILEVGSTASYIATFIPSEYKDGYSVITANIAPIIKKAESRQITSSVTMTKKQPNYTVSIDLTKLSGYPVNSGPATKMVLLDNGKYNGLSEVVLDKEKAILTLTSDNTTNSTNDNIVVSFTDMKNYEDCQITIHVSYKDKKQVEMTGLVSTKVEAYDGKPKVGFKGVLKNEFSNRLSDYVVMYSGTNYGPTTTPPSEIGNYTVSISVPSDNALYEGSIRFDFSIKRIYSFKKGLNSTYSKDSKQDFVLIVDADFKKFTQIEINDELLDNKHYSVKKGSTIITLKASYLASLNEGNHKIKILFQDGEATTNLTIKRGAPETADTSNTKLLLFLILTAGLYIGVRVIKHNRKEIKS